MDTPCKEIEIPVPWGHIAGKLWGHSNGRPLLALHGKQDNCGVFDRIIPSLRGDYHVVAFDAPGHGLSSHFPAGVPLDLLNDVIAVMCVLDYMKWKRCFLVGHSMGGQVGLLFTAAFPEYVEKIMIIDHISPTVSSPSFAKTLRSHVKEFLALNDKLKTGKEPVYTYQEAKEKLTNRNSVLNDEAAEIVMKRSLKKLPNGYTFRMDQRLKLHSLPMMTTAHLLDLLQNVQCPIMCVFSSERFSAYEVVFEEAFALLRQKQNYTEKVVYGNHDFHQNHPERIIGLIDEFFGKSWGDSTSEKRILLVHGIQHNCAAFDRLIPLLPRDYNHVAIDLPGHGLSSHYPAGLPLNFYNYVYCVKQCADFLHWDTFVILGHSFGSQLATYFASIFPGRVQLLIVIDSMEPRPVPVDETLQHLRTVARQHFELNEKLSSREAPVYTYDEVFQKTQKNGQWPLTSEAAADLLQRSITPHKSGYRFVTDQRLKHPMRPVLTFDQQIRILDGVECSVLFILAEGNMERYGSYLKHVYEYNSTKPDREIVVVGGDHAVHQNHPERVGALVRRKLSEFEATRNSNS